MIDQATPTHLAPRAGSEEARAYQYIIDLVYERCRVRLHDGKQMLIRARLGKRMRHHGLDSLAAYCELLRSMGDSSELTHVVDALTTNFTHFLREEDHFKFLVKQALPSVLGKGESAIHIWSAACATGEEPYSMAFYLSEHFPLAGGWNWKVHASDISTKALGTAQTGVYSSERVEAIPNDWLRKYFQRGSGQWEGHYRVKPSIASRIQFQQLNLIDTIHLPQKFHVIFCRNVMIYFDRPTQEHVVRQLTEHLLPGGFLFVGHSESLNGLSIPLLSQKPSIYQKPPHARTDARRII